MKTGIRKAFQLVFAITLCSWGCNGDQDSEETGDAAHDTSQPDSDLLEEDGISRPDVVIPTGDVARLYEVVNDPSYAGYRVVLEPGTYALDEDLDPSGLGYLSLQDDMALVGANEYRDYQDASGNPEPDGIWDPWDATADPEQFPDPTTETVIDCSSISPSSVPITTCSEALPSVDVPPPCISLAPGNRISRVTVRNYEPEEGSLVGFDLSDPEQVPEADETAPGEITDCLIENGWHGISVRVQGCPMEGVDAEVTITRNILRGCGFTGLFLGSCFTRDVTLRASVSDNRIVGNLYGFCAFASTSSDRCELVVQSTNNINQSNAVVGGWLFTLMDYPFAYPLVGGNDNTLDWTSQGDWIVGNAASPDGGLGGLLIGGAFLHGSPTDASRNVTEVHFLDVTFAGPGEAQNRAYGLGRADIVATGFVAPSATGGGYASNETVLEAEGCTSDGTPIYFDHACPDNPDDTNRVTFVGGADSLAGSNNQIPGATAFDCCNWFCEEE
ncbi:MAG: hypothetical protein JW797_20555 [Bradymonadales bacterium]|nr:hypothetical protein [Bradymonadales bacterium]